MKYLNLWSSLSNVSHVYIVQKIEISFNLFVGFWLRCVSGGPLEWWPFKLCDINSLVVASQKYANYISHWVRKKILMSAFYWLTQKTEMDNFFRSQWYLIEFCRNDVHWIQWIVTQSKNGLVTRGITQLPTDTLPFVIVQYACPLLPLVRYPFWLTTVQSQGL